MKAFRDTWRDGIHSYLTFLCDRLAAARDLLTESGSDYVQISDENVHRVRAVMDELFGPKNFRSCIYFSTTGGLATNGLSRNGDYVLWVSKSDAVKIRPLFNEKRNANDEASAYKNVELPDGTRRRLTGLEQENLSTAPE